MRRVQGWAAVLALMWLGVGSSSGGWAASGLGVVSGRVFDAKTGEPLASANVVLAGTMRGAATDVSGNFRIAGLRPGNYVLRVTMIGYDPATLSVTVEEGREALVEFRLQPSILQAQHIVVTATRAERLLENVPVVTEVVPMSEIREKGANDLADALHDRPGVVIDASSSGGKILRMNGVDGRRILLLVDGVPVAGKVNDRHELELFDADEIERIEIVKGPGSSLYGSDAMGGVVNVITQPISQDFQLHLRTRAGEYGLANGNLSLSGTTRGWGYALAVDHTRQGARRSTSEIQVKDFASSSGKIKVQRAWSSGRVEGRLLYRKTSQEADLQMSGRQYDTGTNVRHWDSGFRLVEAFSPRLTADVTGYGSWNFREYRSVAAGRAPSLDTTREDLWGVRSDLRWAATDWLTADIGYDASVDRYESPRVRGASRRWQQGAFGQAEVRALSLVTLNAGARYDKITDLQGRWSPRVSAMLQPLPAVKIRGSWGMGFRAPSFIEMYSYFVMPIPGRPVYLIGNEALKPETSVGWNAGVEYAFRERLFTSLTYYENRFRDLIADYWQKIGTVLSYRNIDRATFKSLEWQGKAYILANLWASVAYNYTRVSEDEEYPTLGISPHMANLRLNWRLLRNRVNLSARLQGFSATDVTEYVRDASGALVPRTSRRNAYALLDATLTIQLRRLLDLRVGATNLTDYTNASFGPYLGRRAFIDLEFSM
ncbi:MAG: TonB-dependent receptor [candidate division KSB1 bacterium]|nr:TonB-dependent receptor [candidate division KSB1 bacterium]